MKLCYVEGLRAVAVMGVVLFHFGAWWLPGGFAGVDVFFVISGFVISRSVFREMEAGKFSLLDFYWRRARRIIPALVVVILASMLVGGVILYPSQLVELAKSSAAAMAFSSNIYFFWTIDYFGTNANEVPLLHYWSLGVEEQFYLIYPFLLLFIFRSRRDRLVSILVALAFTSLALSEWALRKNPEAAFYLLPFRAYELLLGGIVAAIPAANSRVAQLAAPTGAVLIAGSMLILNENYPFPGIWGLAPCLGTAMVIWSGENNVVSRLLSVPVLQFLGAISFSLYLVHWPVVVFTSMFNPDLSGPVLLIGGCAASVGLAWLIYVLVEQPTRHASALSRRLTFSLSGGALTVSAFIGLGIVWLDGFPGRVDAAVSETLAYQKYDFATMFRQSTCFLRPEETVADLDLETCLPPDVDTVLWGDSHIAQLYWGLEAEYKKRGRVLGQLTASGCPLVPGVDFAARPNCRSFVEETYRILLERRPRTVILHGGTLSPEHEALIDEVIAVLRGAGIQVVVLGQAPIFSKPVPLLVADRLLASRHGFMSGDDLLPGLIEADATAARHFADGPYISYFTVGCTNGQCPLAIEDIPLHFDIAHLTREGSVYYASRMIDFLF